MMLVILLSTFPLRDLLTRDEPEKRLRLSELPAEIRAKGYHWHISLYVVMYVYKFLIDQHNEPMKPRVGGYTHWVHELEGEFTLCLLYTSPSPRDRQKSRMPSSA